ncbi:TPA: hypothetical protein ACYLN4_006839 [Burkholderia lata]
MTIEAEMTPPWVPAHERAGVREGWIISSTGPGPHNWQLQCIDTPEDLADGAFVPPVLGGDDKAFKIVANGCDIHHIAARAFLRTHAPREYEGVMREADLSKLDPEDIPAFSPRLEAGEGGSLFEGRELFYRDGRILGAVDTGIAEGTKLITISEWSSFFPNRGHTKAALQWLRDQGYSIITANGVGTLDDIDGKLVGDISTAYWAKMHQAGLVDVLIDDDGNALAVDSDGSVSFKVPT